MLNQGSTKSTTAFMAVGRMSAGPGAGRGGRPPDGRARPEKKKNCVGVYTGVAERLVSLPPIAGFFSFPNLFRCRLLAFRSADQLLDNVRREQADSLPPPAGARPPRLVLGLEERVSPEDRPECPLVPHAGDLDLRSGG